MSGHHTMSDHHVFTCPVCGKGSTQDQDAEDGYCGVCHAQTGLPVQLTINSVSAIIGHLNRVSDEPIARQLIDLLGQTRAVYLVALTIAEKAAGRTEKPAP
jgi:transcription elongation factor Elf1